MTEARGRPAEGRRERRTRETRTALLDAAMALLKERGIYGTRVEDITERADVGKGVFYNYFESKEALVAHLVSEGVELLEREYLDRLEDVASLKGRIESLARAQEAFFHDHPELAMVIHQARGLLLLDTERASSLRDAFADYLQRLSRRIPAARDAGAWSAEDLLDVAAAIAGSATGYRSFCIAVGRPIHVKTIGATLVAGIPSVLEERRCKAASSRSAQRRTRPHK